MLNLNTEIIGKKIIYLQETDSTNEFAKKIALMESDGTVVIADVQKKGKGRKLRKWSSPKGGLWMSVILKPNLHPKHITKLVFISALAVVETLEEFGIEGKIKWPNDVLVDGKKICGILSEGKYSTDSVEYVVLGIGLNVNNPIPKDLSNIATSMREILGFRVPIVEVFKKLVEKLDRWYLKYLDGQHSIILEKWKAHSAVIGNEVKIIGDEEEIIGTAVDVSDDGSLIIALKNGTLKKIYYGDLSLKLS